MAKRSSSSKLPVFMGGPKWKWRAGIVLTIVVVVCATTWTIAHRRHDFDSATWKQPNVRAVIREEMADDIVASRRLVGLSREEVISILGQPPQTSYFSEYDFVYHLGPERGFLSIDSEWLVVKLGSNGRVSRAAVVRD